MMRPAPILTHFVLVEHGISFGQLFDETGHSRSFDEVVTEIASGQFDDVQMVFCADQAGATFHDVSGDVADALARRPWDELSAAAQDLCERFGVAPCAADEDRRSPADEHGTHSLMELA